MAKPQEAVAQFTLPHLVDNIIVTFRKHGGTLVDVIKVDFTRNALTSKTYEEANLLTYVDHTTYNLSIQNRKLDDNKPQI